MLTVDRPDMQVALTVVRWRQRYQFEWTRFFLTACVLFHLGMASVIGFTPEQQIVTHVTQPVFDLAPRPAWALMFLAGAAGAMLLRHHNCRPVTQMLTWLTVFPSFLAWEAAFVLAVVTGGGSWLAALIWPFLYLPFAVTAVRLGLGKR